MKNLGQQPNYPHSQAGRRSVANMAHWQKSAKAAEHLPSGEGQLLLPLWDWTRRTEAKSPKRMRLQTFIAQAGYFDGWSGSIWPGPRRLSCGID
jgi:hypothetical protein